MVSAMVKVDFKKELKELYRPSNKEVSLVTVPSMNFLMIDGEGSPSEEAGDFEGAMEALYPLAYKIKFMAKSDPEAYDFVVPPLEGLWWADDWTAFTEDRKDEWKWTLMIMQPDCVSLKMFEEARELVRAKSAPRLLDRVRFDSYEEGEACQIMHIGPFSEEGPKVHRIHDHIDSLGKARALKHHEIYLSDPRRTAPEKLKTVLRQPMR